MLIDYSSDKITVKLGTSASQQSSAFTDLVSYAGTGVLTLGAMDLDSAIPIELGDLA